MRKLLIVSVLAFASLAGCSIFTAGKPKLVRLELRPPEYNLRARGQYFIAIVGVDDRGSTVPVTGATATSSDSSVANIVGNYLNTGKPGQADLTLSATYNGGLVTSRVRVSAFIEASRD